jgi:hypothetical protein
MTIPTVLFSIQQPATRETANLLTLLHLRRLWLIGWFRACLNLPHPQRLAQTRNLACQELAVYSGSVLSFHHDSSGLLRLRILHTQELSDVRWLLSSVLFDSYKLLCSQRLYCQRKCKQTPRAATLTNEMLLIIVQVQLFILGEKGRQRRIYSRFEKVFRRQHLRQTLFESYSFGAGK